MFLLYLFVFILGLCIGSFLNVVVLRLEKSESLGGRSYCPRCKHALAWFDLVPVFSFLFLRGKCRYCPDNIEDPRQSRDHKKISWQYPIIEISTAVIFLLIFNFQFSSINQLSISKFSNLLFLWYVASALIVIFAYDFKHYLIPDKVLFPAIAIALAYRVFEFLHFAHWDLFGIWNLGFWISAPLIWYILASFLATAFFLSIFMVSGGRAMGFGDVKLAILMGLLLGFPNILVALLLAFWIGAIIGLTLMALRNKGLKSEIPFGPFLITGTFVALFWGPQVINWYTHFLMF